MQPARLRLLFERVPAVKTPFLLLEHRIDVDRDRVGGRIDYYYNQVGGSACVSAARGYVSWHTHTHPPRDVCLRTWCHTGDELSGERVVFETCRRPGDKIAPTQNKNKKRRETIRVHKRLVVVSIFDLCRRLLLEDDDAFFSTLHLNQHYYYY